MLELTGTSRADAGGEAKIILNFEAELASSVMTIAEKRDLDKAYHLSFLVTLTRFTAAPG